MNRLLCKTCKYSFSINHKRKETFWIQHVDGVPFRKLADQAGLSVAQVYRKVKEEMDQLPENTWLSSEYGQRWSGRLNIDGKYVKVKGYDRKIPFIYCIDFLTHDIPVGILAPSENEEAFSKLFSLLKACRYPLQIAICDDTSALKPALLRFYPNARIQICQNHYLENIRQRLQIRTLEKYRRFFGDMQVAFSPKLHPARRNAYLSQMFNYWGRKDTQLQLIMIEIMARRDELFAYNFKMNQCPNTNNIIEAFNSHIQARLKSIKGFESFHSAERWLNAWMIRRRTKPFTDCDRPFKHLNGKTSLETVLKIDKSFPKIRGVKAPKLKR